jgi:hypothetical protein
VFIERLTGVALRAHLAQAIIERLQRDSQFFRSLWFVALIFVQYPQNHHFFHFPQRFGIAAED